MHQYLLEQSRTSPCHTCKIVIGLDYGTTGTGVSVAVFGSNGLYEEIIQWPPNHDVPKVPSRIAYPVDNQSFPMHSSHWGFDVQNHMRAYWWTKLFLDSHAELAEFDDHVLKRTVSLDIPHQSLPPDSDRAPVNIITDYLTHVLKYVWKLIWRRYAGLNSVNFTVDLLYTIPATWSEQGERLSREAVARAWNFKRPEDTLTIMREPDAAAESVYQKLKDDIQVGDGILICDCGGGTVDITTIGRLACEMPYYDDGHFILTDQDLHALFDPVFYSIASLVNSQIMAANQAYGSPVINKIALVGGMASSPYLYRTLRQCFEIPGRFSVVLPSSDPSMAVASGSVLRALRREEVVELRSPRHYGLESALSQNVADHQLMADQVRAQAEIEWVITKGQQYRQGHTYSNDLSLLYHDGDAMMMTIPIYSCELSNPPCLANTAQFEDITLAGFIVVDLMSINLKYCVRQKDLDTGLSVYRLDCSVEFVFDAENGRLDFAVKILGQVVGKYSAGLRF
ncbi:actin-like ATPase domain-containing protein [Penicillium verhagenii]|nr:actin-like ATPase domain-containing protein [Penicillium verhagenii]